MMEAYLKCITLKVFQNFKNVLQNVINISINTITTTQKLTYIFLIQGPQDLICS